MFRIPIRVIMCTHLGECIHQHSLKFTQLFKFKYFYFQSFCKTKQFFLCCCLLFAFCRRQPTFLHSFLQQQSAFIKQSNLFLIIMISFIKETWSFSMKYFLRIILMENSLSFSNILKLILSLLLLAIKKLSFKSLTY